MSDATPVEARLSEVLPTVLVMGTIRDMWADLTQAEKDAAYAKGFTRWEVRYRDSEGAHKRRFVSRKDAAAHLRTNEGRVIEQSTGLTVTDAIDSYIRFKTPSVKPKTLENLLFHAEHVKARWGDTQVSQIGRIELAAWVHDESRGASSSRAKQLGLLRSSIHWVTSNGQYTDPDPTRDIQVRVKHREVEHLTVEELQLVAKRARYSYTNKHAPEPVEKPNGKMWESLILWSGLTGTRMNETRGLKVGDLTQGEGHWFVRVRGTKTESSDRVIPVMDSLIPLLDLERKPSAPLFEVSTGNPPTKEAMRRCLDRACEQAVGRRVNWHSLRHTAATNAVNSGMSPATAAAYLGQKSQNVLLATYSHAGMRDLERLVDRLDEGLEESRRREEHEAWLLKEFGDDNPLTVEFTDEELA